MGFCWPLPLIRRYPGAVSHRGLLFYARRLFFDLVPGAGFDLYFLTEFFPNSQKDRLPGFGGLFGIYEALQVLGGDFVVPIDFLLLGRQAVGVFALVQVINLNE